jgi:hypothetical protein
VQGLAQMLLLERTLDVNNLSNSNATLSGFHAGHQQLHREARSQQNGHNNNSSNEPWKQTILL